MNVGEKIRKIRTEKKMTQQDLATALGVSQAMVAQYENGTRQPKEETRIKIAAALDVDAFALYDIEQVSKMLEELDKINKNAVTQGKEAFESIVSSLVETTSRIATQTSEDLPPKENQLLYHYGKLNDFGQKEAVKRVKELTQIDEYTKEEE